MVNIAVNIVARAREFCHGSSICKKWVWPAIVPLFSTYSMPCTMSCSHVLVRKGNESMNSQRALDTDGGMLLVVINGGLLPSLIAVCCNQWVKWAPGPPWRRSCWPPAVQRPPRGGLPIGDVTAFWHCNRPLQTPATTITTILHACTKTFALSRPVTTVCRPDHLRRGRREAVLLASTTKGNLSLH